MCFVDGTNFLKRVKEALELEITPLKPSYEILELAFHWIGRIEAYIFRQLSAFDRIIPVRRYWFCSYQGDQLEHDRIADTLRTFRFEPRLYKKDGSKLSFDVFCQMDEIRDRSEKETELIMAMKKA